MAADNRQLGKFMLDGITARPRGIPQIEVTSTSMPQRYILNVKARDKGTARNRDNHYRFFGPVQGRD
jgi:molecular chaperone DnaK